jgi:iron complex outermembrane recepter protein
MAFQRTPMSQAARAALAALALPAIALAQSAPAPGDEPADAKKATTQLETVIVTSSKRAQPVYRVPYNVSALSEEALRDENITDIKKLIAQNPAISAPGNSARFADSVTVRGLNVSPVNANNLEQFTRSTLAYYLDDTPLPNISYRIKDVTRVETLLGPQGTLYGAGSLGGTIRYITNKPQLGKLSARLNTSVYQTSGGGLSNDTDGVFNVPFDDRVALRVALARLDEKGYLDRVSNPPWRTGADAWVTQPDANKNVYEDDNWQRVDGGRLSMLWKLTRDIELTYSHTEQDQLANGTNAVSLLPLEVANATTPDELRTAWTTLRQPWCTAQGRTCSYTDRFSTPFAVNDRTTLARYPEFAKRRFRMDAIDLDVEFNAARLHSSTSKFQDSRVGQADYTGQGNLFYFGFGDSGGDLAGPRSAFTTFDNTYEGVSHETRLVSKGDGPFSWIGGIYYTKQDKSNQFSEFLPGLDDYISLDRAAAGGFADEGYRETLSNTYREKALYGEAAYKLTPWWQVTLGGRVFNYDDTGRSNLRDYTFDLVNSVVEQTGGATRRKFYRFNTSFQLGQDLLSYFTFSQGFRRGGTNGFKDFNNQVVADSARFYQPDSINNQELGLKGYFADRAVYVEASVYRMIWKDTQTYWAQEIENFFPVNGTANGPDARTQGFELLTRLRLGEQWQLSFSTAGTSAKFTEERTQCIYEGDAVCRTWNAGDRLGGSNKLKHAAGVSFTTGIGSDWTLMAALGASYYGKKQADRQDGPGLPRVFDSYTLVDASVKLSGGNWDAMLWVDNLTNKRAETSTSNDRALGNRLIYTQPRTIGVNLSYAFD